MANYWMKLYYEILDDPKMGRLPDRIYRRVIELFLLAGDYDNDGRLPSIQDIAWRLRLSETELQDDLNKIMTVGIIVEQDGYYVVTNFAKRQAASPVNERVQRYRDEKRKDQYFGNETLQASVTTRYTDTDTDTDIDKIRGDIDTDKIVTTPPPASYSHFSLQDAEKLYRDVTGQITIPPRSSNGDGSNDYLESLLTISAAYDDKTKILEDGKRHYAKWTNTRGKNGAFYKRTNPGWVSWWLNELAPKPEAPDPIRFDVPTAICEVAYNLKRQAEQEPEYYGKKLREHIATCDFCGGKSIVGAAMPDDVKKKMAELLGRKAIK